MSRPTLAAPLALTALILTLCLPAQALARSDLYRVELLLFERLSPSLVEKSLSSESRNWLPEYGVPLWVDTQWQGNVKDAPEGALGSDRVGVTSNPRIDRLPTEELRLTPVRDSLERSGSYRVLSFTGWENSFPDGYKTAPLVVDLTNTFDGERAIKGFIQIERRRFLHVDAQIYDLRPNDSATDNRQPSREETSLQVLQRTLEAEGNNGRQNVELIGPRSESDTPEWQVITWLRELRRMRSEEVHYLDSPTIGLLVYFHPLKEEKEEEADSGDESQEGDTPESDGAQ